MERVLAWQVIRSEDGRSNERLFKRRASVEEIIGVGRGGVGNEKEKKDTKEIRAHKFII